MPDVWGASTKTLPMDKVKDIDFYKKGDEYILKTNISVKDADLLYIETESDTSAEIILKAKNLKNILTFSTKKGKILAPLDNFPSWLMADKIDEITLISDKPVELKSVKLYKRK